MSDEGLERELLRLDVLLRRKQLWWEHPRNAAVLLGVIVAMTAAVSGVLGFQLARRPAPTITVHLDAPLVVKGQ